MSLIRFFDSVVSDDESLNRLDQHARISSVYFNRNRVSITFSQYNTIMIKISQLEFAMRQNKRRFMLENLLSQSRSVSQSSVMSQFATSL